MIPKVPSEPENNSRRSGPAAEAGARPMSSVPTGVMTRMPRSMSENRPYPAES